MNVHIAGIIASSLVTAAPAVTTWNPADKHPSITLSNSDKSYQEATAAGWLSVRSTTSKTSGKWYYEVRFDTAANFSDYGFGNSAAGLAGYPGQNTNSVGVVSNGEVFRNGSLGLLMSSFTTGDVVCLALDIANFKFWVRKNGGAWNNLQGGTQDPATNQGGQALASAMTGAIFCMGGTSNTATRQTGRWAAADFSYSPPSGFLAWGS